jgi:hypothetical protein
MPSNRRHHTVSAIAVLVTATGLSVAGSSVASAQGPGHDCGSCEESLGRALIEVGDTVVFSDAYYSYLLRQPLCDGWSATTPR